MNNAVAWLIRKCSQPGFGNLFLAIIINNNRFKIIVPGNFFKRLHAGLGQKHFISHGYQDGDKGSWRGHVIDNPVHVHIFQAPLDVTANTFPLKVVLHRPPCGRNGVVLVVHTCSNAAGDCPPMIKDARNMPNLLRLYFFDTPPKQIVIL